MLTIHRCTVLVDLPIDPFIIRSLSQKKPSSFNCNKKCQMKLHFFVQKIYIQVYFIPKLSNLYWMPNSFSRGFGSAIRAVGYITANQMILQKPICECHVSFTSLWIEAICLVYPKPKLKEVNLNLAYRLSGVLLELSFYEPALMVRPKCLLTEFGIHPRLESFVILSMFKFLSEEIYLLPLW